MAMEVQKLCIRREQCRPLKNGAFGVLVHLKPGVIYHLTHEEDMEPIADKLVLIYHNVASTPIKYVQRHDKRRGIFIIEVTEDRDLAHMPTVSDRKQ